MTWTPRPAAAARPMTSLLDVDPDLARDLSPAGAAAARSDLLVVLARLPEGPLLLGRGSPPPGHLGMLVADGLVARELLAHDVASLELLGPGDLLRPWRPLGDEALLLADVRWSVLAEARVAILDRQLCARLGHYPEIHAVLMEKVVARAQRLAVTQAVCQLNRVDHRVLTVLWHLAGRWGRITPRGTRVPLALSHRMLGQLVGARRPTVSTACGELARRGEVIREPDGTWLLTGEPVGAPCESSRRFVAPRRRVMRAEAVGS